jgi:polyisoprenoid-binding protein YceI
MTDGIAQIPGFIAGTRKLDPAHSDVGFVVGHLVVSKVHGRFDAFSRTVVTDEDLARTSVSVSIEAASVNTHLPRARQPGPLRRLSRHRALPEHHIRVDGCP